MPKPTLVALPRSNGLKLSIHLFFFKKNSLCCTYPDFCKAWACFGCCSNSCWVTELQAVSFRGKLTAATLWFCPHFYCLLCSQACGRLQRTEIKRALKGCPQRAHSLMGAVDTEIKINKEVPGGRAARGIMETQERCPWLRDDFWYRELSLMWALRGECCSPLMPLKASVVFGNISLSNFRLKYLSADLKPFACLLVCTGNVCMYICISFFAQISLVSLYCPHLARL